MKRKRRRTARAILASGRTTIGWSHVDVGTPNVVTIAAPSANRKLGPVAMEANTTERLRPVPQRPYVAATMLPIRQTCSDACTFKGSGCMASEGFTGGAVRKLERTADEGDLTPLRIIEIEAAEIDRTWRGPGAPRAQGLPKHLLGVPQLGGRHGTSGIDLRLHVAGDIPDSLNAGMRSAWALAGAAKRYQARGGGSVWSFTHSWRTVERRDWGPISVLASIEHPDDAEYARARGYAPALVVDAFPRSDTFALRGTRYTACPAETRGTTCVKCRLCLDHTDYLRDNDRGIAFAVHGTRGGIEKARRRLTVVQTRAL